jgi:PB1 domain
VGERDRETDKRDRERQTREREKRESGLVVSDCCGISPFHLTLYSYSFSVSVSHTTTHKNMSETCNRFKVYIYTNGWNGGKTTIRRFAIEGSLSFDTFVLTLKRLDKCVASFQSVLCTYLDDEQDWITVSSDECLQEAYEQYCNASKHVITLHICGM